jgi:hypothetical protein
LAARLLFTNAGNAPSNNLARSLRTGTEPIFIVGCNDDQFTLKKSDVITAYGDNETKRKAMEGGAEGLLIKPIDFASLLEEIDTRLERKGHVRSARVFQTSTCSAVARHHLLRCRDLMARRGVDPTETLAASKSVRVRSTRIVAIERGPQVNEMLARFSRRQYRVGAGQCQVGFHGRPWFLQASHDWRKIRRAGLGARPVTSL